MTGPFKACGIDLLGYRLTLRRLKEWTDTGTPHTVLLHARGGVFTSNGDGIYESVDIRFDSLVDFWQYARDFRGRAVMWSSSN